MDTAIVEQAIYVPLVVIALREAEVRVQVDTKILFQTLPPLFLAPGFSQI